MNPKSEQNSPALIGASGDSLREAFGLSLVAVAEEFPNMVVLDADVAGGTGAHHFRAAYPNRFFQFGIAEQNMVSAAAGMAAAGLLPVVTTFAVFHLRALEQARLSVAYPRRNVKLVASHPGLDVGPDGGSAQALEDIAAFRAVPGMTVLSPADPGEMHHAVRAMLTHQGPIYMRTGRSPAQRVPQLEAEFQIGKGIILCNGSDATIVSCGVGVARAVAAATLLKTEGIQVRVVAMSSIKPIDEDLLRLCSEETGCIVTVEDHNVYGGLGGAVAEALATLRPCPMEFVGVQDVFGESGEPEELARKYGIDESAVLDAVHRVLGRKQ